MFNKPRLRRLRLNVSNLQLCVLQGTWWTVVSIFTNFLLFLGHVDHPEYAYTFEHDLFCHKLHTFWLTRLHLLFFIQGRRLKIMRKQRSEFEVLAQVAGRFSGERKNRIVIGSLAHETKETKDDNVVVNNFLETMEVEVKPQPGLENLSQVLLSKDWLALGPSMPNSPITQEENFDSRSKIGKIKSSYHSRTLLIYKESFFTEK